MKESKHVSKEVEIVTYLIEFGNGTRKRITVPSFWKVTFGPAAAGTAKPTGYKTQMPLALRFYESPQLQRAIFTDVVSFRDTSIKVEDEIMEVKEKVGFIECDGVRKQTVFQAKTREWVNPDAALPQKNLLPTDSEMYSLEVEGEQETE